MVQYEYLTEKLNAMHNPYNTFILDHTLELIDFLEARGYTEQSAVITTVREESPMKIVVMKNSNRFFSICSDQIKTTIKIARAVIGEAPQNITIDQLRKEIENG